MDQTIQTILTGVLIAGTTSWITVQLSLRKFRSEKWWERKADAYTRLLDALHKSKKFSDEHLEADYKVREVSEERDKELRNLAKESREELLRAVDVGAFLLCDEAVEVLRIYGSEIEKLSGCETWFEYIDAENTINHRTLVNLIPIAREDLNT